jgi:hypothetical protein
VRDSVIIPEKGEYMKFILMLLVIVSCGSQNNEKPYLFKSEKLLSTWQNTQGKRIIIDSATITFKDVSRGLSSSDCLFDYTIEYYNDFYATVTLSNLVGDSYVCSGINETLGLGIVFDSRTSEDILTILGSDYKTI